ncbi:MAG TPA: hypothetical protein VND45_05265 [Thermoanaerobaculia bacterium]|jgi:hypothetical protein|nr:hypothetical protein [Thermoanaerobaculia bacterium]
MSTVLEAMLLLLPPDAGGRSAPVAPREGSYRPFARHGPRIVRARLFEGPPLLGPGEEDRVMLELESELDNVSRGAELEILERENRVVGVATVLRVCAG